MTNITREFKNIDFVGGITSKLSNLDDRFGNAPICIFKDFNINFKISKAFIDVTTLGIYELFLNGEKVGDALFAPGFTDYNKLLYVQRYDLTNKISIENNRIGVMIGDGWYTGHLSNIGRKNYGDYPLAVKFKLIIEGENNETIEINSDTDCRFCESIIDYSDFFMGERQDFNKCSLKDIFTYNKILGNRCIIKNHQEVELNYDVFDKVRVIEKRLPTSIKNQNNAFIYDIGQNLAGFVKIKATGLKGSKVTIRYGEMLCDDGSLYTENLRSALSTDEFLCSGNEDLFLPHFTYHGFRYVEIICENAIILDFTCMVISTDLKKVGDFHCDNVMVNKIYSNAMWGLKSNFVEIPTDCPQRDERMGWLGDAQVFCPSAMYRLECNNFYRKYLRNIRDTINKNGAPCDVAPRVRCIWDGSAAWGDAIVIIPYKSYLFYGDKSIIIENYSAMEAWINYQLVTSTDYIRPNEGYGDWLSIKLDDTPKELIGTAYFAYTCYLLAFLSKQIENYDKECYYTDLFEKVKKAFNDKFVDDDINILGDTQTSYILALSFNLLYDDKKEKAKENLLKKIKSDNFHLSCGFVGISLLLPCLSELGLDDIAYTILLNETYPSWGYCINNGATTIWERWNSYTKEFGFGDVSMNSFNHYSLGSVVEWMTGYMCGIRPSKDGKSFNNITIEPHIDPLFRIKNANASYTFENQEISVSWFISNNKIIIKTFIPSNVSAKLNFNNNIINLENGFSKNTFSI